MPAESLADWTPRQLQGALAAFSVYRLEQWRRLLLSRVAEEQRKLDAVEAALAARRDAGTR
jgi:hypothetical protein